MHYELFLAYESKYCADLICKHTANRWAKEFYLFIYFWNKNRDIGISWGHSSLAILKALLFLLHSIMNNSSCQKFYAGHSCLKLIWIAIVAVSYWGFSIAIGCRKYLAQEYSHGNSQHGGIKGALINSLCLMERGCGIHLITFLAASALWLTGGDYCLSLKDSSH